MAAAKPAVEGGKKKSKMPIIIALVVVLAAGGFFGSKMGGSKVKKEPVIELGEVVSLGEFLVNLSDGRTFLKTEISVHVAKEQHIAEAGDGHGAKAEPPAQIRDAVVAVLSSQDLDYISTPEGKLALKKLLAKAINAVVPHEKEKEKEGDKEKKSKKKKDEHAEEEKVIDESWDSQHGPVLKVYFTSFAAQQ